MKKFIDFLASLRWICVLMLFLLLLPVVASYIPVTYLYAEGVDADPETVDEFVFYDDVQENNVSKLVYDPMGHSVLYYDMEGNAYYLPEKLDGSLRVGDGVQIIKVSFGTMITVSCFLVSIFLVYTLGKEFRKREVCSSSFDQVDFSQPAQQAVQPKTKSGTQTAAKPQEKKGEKLVIEHVSFDDVAGYQQTKDSMQFLVTCLKNQKKLDQMGVKMPRGVLLYGPPGTGKTLMAKAIACTAQVPFFYASGSQFMEIYVGAGAKNVRAIYEKARKNAPCVVFIDEIDAIGCNRSGAMNDSERKQTLDELLVNLDGMGTSRGVLTIAATNMLGDLDPALTRSGRFDRKIAVPLPNLQDRIAILKVHAKNKRLSSGVDLDDIASMTGGFSGADLAGLLNEAGIIALQKDREVISRSDVEEAMIQVATGGEARGSSDKSVRRLVAYHEAGHAVAYRVIAKQPVSRVTIVGSTSGVGGVTFGKETADTAFPSKQSMEEQICVCYAGRAAEVVAFGESNMTVGASSDIKKATSLIRQYLVNFGMNESVGLIDMDVLANNRMVSSTDSQIVEEARKLSARLYKETVAVLKEYRGLLDMMVDELLRKQSLNEREVQSIFDRYMAKKDTDAAKEAKA